MVVGVLRWIVEIFLILCTSLNGEAEGIVEADWIVEKNQGINLTITTQIESDTNQYFLEWGDFTFIKYQAMILLLLEVYGGLTTRFRPDFLSE